MFGIYDLLAAQGRFRPNKTALIHEGERYSYKELNERVNSFAYALKQHGIGKGSRVGMLLLNGPEFITVFYALIKLGACVSPFNYRYTLAEMEQLNEVVDCEFVISSRSFIELAKQMTTDVTKHDVTVISVDSDTEFPALNKALDNGMETWDFAEKLAEDDVIFNIFTGGTTGIPKAASHTQHSTLVRVMGFFMNGTDCSSEDVYLNYAPLFHIGGLGAMFKILSIGATFCLLSNFDPVRIADTIQRERVTQMSLIPPTILNRFQDIKLECGIDLSSVRILQLAGGLCNERTLELAFELMPDVICVNALGSSENSVYLANAFTREDFYANREIYHAVGKPQILYETKLVKENGEEAAVGEAGEMYGRSPAMLSGYWGKDNTFTDDGWFPTGDILVKDERGIMTFCSRSKDMIKCGGENIYAVEVENALSSHPAVKQCAVVGLPDSVWGEIVAAAVVLQPGQSASEEELVEHCKSHIATYKKPRKIFFVSEIPVTGIGKINKVTLKKQLIKE